MSTQSNTNGNKWNTRFMLGTLATLLIALIGIMLRSYGAGAGYLVQDIKYNGKTIIENREQISANAIKITRNETNIMNLTDMVKDIRNDIKDIKRFVIGTE